MLGLIVSASMLTGCVEEYEADIAEEDANLLVVEGTICANQTNSFRLSWTDPITADYTPEWIPDANVTVRGTDGSVYQTQAGYDKTYNFCYSCEIGDLNPDVEYYLRIELGDEVYESDPQKPLATEKIADVRGTQETEESDIEVLVTPAEPFDASKGNYYSWTYEETWEVRPDYITYWYYDTDEKKAVVKGGQFPACGWKDAIGTQVAVGSSTSYQGQHIERLKVYDISRASERMYFKYSGLVRQRAISKGEYEYELARRQAGEDMGGLFTPLPSALPSNIHCLTSKRHVIGYVGCSLNTSAYRFFLMPQDFSIYRPVLKDTRIWLENPTEIDCMKMVESGMYLCEYDNTEMTPTGQTIVKMAWAWPYQLDVRVRGAYIEEPEYWSRTDNYSL